MTTYVHLWHVAKFFLECEIFQTKVVGKIKTYFIFNFFFPLKSRLIRDYIEKYHKAGQDTDNNIAHALCMLDN